MGKFFRSLFGTGKVDYPTVPEYDITAPQYIKRTPQEQEAFDVYGKRTTERAGAEDITLGTLGKNMYAEMMRRMGTQAAPGFEARGMGGQAGAAGMGAFMAREAPGQWLGAFGAEEDVTSQRLAALQPYLQTGLQERQFEYLPEQEQARMATEKSALQAGMSYGQELLKAQGQAQKYGERRKFWGDLLGTGISAATMGMGGGFGGAGGGVSTFTPT